MPRPMKPIIGMSCRKTERTFFQGQPLPIAFYRLFCSANPHPTPSQVWRSLPLGREDLQPPTTCPAMVSLNL